MSREKKIMTWKEADQRLCACAAPMIHDAMAMRMSQEVFRIRTATPLPETPEDADGNSYPPGIWTGQDTGDVIWSRNEMAPQCFYSFVNLIRLRLKAHRLLLYRNLFGKGNSLNRSKQRSRNPNGRKRGSKFSE
jgi:hypothetical protein